MHVIRADRTTFAFRPDAEPVLRAQPGEVVQFETSPAPVERLFAAGDRWTEVLDINAINAVTGPVYIEGVEPGDAVSVEIIDIRPGDWGWCAAIAGFGLLGDQVTTPMLRRVPIRDGRAFLSDKLSVPIRPMIGCLGLAPATGECSTFRPPFPWGGNYDLLQVSRGNTILFPAQVSGGLFSLGDLHAAMGAAEVTYVSIECPGAATVRLGIRKGLALETPRIEAPDRVYAIGLDGSGDVATGGDFQVARKQATDLLLTYLTAERGLSFDDAYVVISACGDLEFGGPAGAVALASVPLSVLA
ncbi:MAG TPA: acetamidase/formamidase family protein [Thermomicrobiales bacterium]|nr:acetamidase/formamidase family protein [Thermomicrobiales bacterium]